MSEHCGAVKITVRARLEDVRPDFAKGLGRAMSLPELGAKDSFAVGGSSGTTSDIGFPATWARL